MLQSLTIDNFAIIEHVSIDFSEKMTVLSGETGAGKSIIIDALGILCGGRGSNEMIRHGSDKLMVEGLFIFERAYPELQRKLEKFGIDIQLPEEELVLRREINQSGKNIIRINGQLANVTTLKAIGSYLVDIHGQNEHQSLLDSDQHLALLDQFGEQSFKEALISYRKAFQLFYRSKMEWLKAQKNEQDQMQRLQFLEFQIQELEQAQLVVGEDEELQHISTQLQHAQQLNANLQAVNYLLTDDNTSVLTQLTQISTLLTEIEKLNPLYATLNAQIKASRYELEEVAHTLAMSQDGLDDDNQTLDEIESRISQLGQLKKKFGMSIEELIHYFDAISEEVYQIKHREQYLADLQEKLIKYYHVAMERATILHEMRITQATQLAQSIQNELKDLYMPNCTFKVAFADKRQDAYLAESISNAILLDKNGFDSAEFYAATNVGEELKPLVKVASGGELSRFMLALKRVFSLTLVPKAMIFDEIDSGVSGRVAQAIAEKMAQIASAHQVLCITHLAQVAAIADDQLLIAKRVSDQRTFTEVSMLDESGRENMIASMISGKDITESAKQMAIELRKQLRRKED